ncbi:uncharacterized protein LOC134696148 [Mytilus trossulus]|uniref:uncharacterized protein LOC134696148 n=1 Tax=Mytilus trossulus TaxID=6551 RepID=UPI00300475C3
MMVGKYLFCIYLVFVSNYILPTAAQSTGSCGVSALTRNSSETRIQFIEFSGDNAFDCKWFINGPAGKPIYLALNYLTIGGDCSQSSIDFTFTNNANETYCTENITSETPLPIATGHATIHFRSNIDSFRHAFKVSFKSYIAVEEPFSDNVRGDIGVILAIVLGVVLLGSMFVAVTFCTIKLYLRCKNRDPEPSEMTAITNIRAETMRAITLKDDFDIKPLSRLVRAKTGSTERILQTREAYA